MKRLLVVNRDNPNAAIVLDTARAEVMRRYLAGESCEIEIREPRRSLDANAAMWATLADIAGQVDWPHTHAGEWVTGRMDSDSWKAVLTAAFEAETRMAQGIGGAVVMLGARTSKFSKRRMGEFLEFCNAFGSEKGIQWSDKALEDLAQWAPAERSAA